MEGLSEVDEKNTRVGHLRLDRPIGVLSKQEFWAHFHILNTILIQLTNGEALSSIDLPNNMIYFTKKQFVIRLRLSLPSLFKQFFHFTQIPLVFLHSNIVRILMGCNVLDMFFQLDISLLKVLFIYTIKMSHNERFNLYAHIPSLQLVTNLPDSSKG